MTDNTNLYRSHVKLDQQVRLVQLNVVSKLRDVLWLIDRKDSNLEKPNKVYPAPLIKMMLLRTIDNLESIL